MPTPDRCVLLVEDNPDDAALALEALRTNRIVSDVVHVADGAAARDYLFGLAAHAGRDVCEMPQLVLLDLKLPKLSGLDVLGHMRRDERTRFVPVVVLTSSDEDEDLVQSYGLGANSFIRKPVEFDRFLEAIRQVSLYWLALNQAPPEPSLGRAA
jgi:two-component system response regulator